MKRKIIKGLCACVVVVVLLLVGCYVTVSLKASGRTYDNTDDIPAREYGLLLGTSPITPGGARNFYFENRIASATDLYNAGKVKKIIVSGGDYRSSGGYDEPQAMADSLVAHGVPCDIIIKDYDGTRTLNSIVKAKEGFGIDSVTLISQKYHNERAIAQADKFGLDAIGFNAPHSPVFRNRVKNILREFPARIKLYLDLWFGKKPEYPPTDSL